MFDSRYVKGIKPAAFDSQINDFLSSGPEGGGNAMRFAIENEQGQVYRHITAHGMGSYIRLNLFLSNDLGLHDKHKETSKGAHYCVKID
ncbi:hypothetical protein [Aeromonas sp. sif2416]|uniref:hypothetical protein n=1 Tax=Aeromonas sp. sif2416 TaxID=2854793 RepID=UPI001C47F47B|nr:hypothetical protein [Aeromonas sp. sif2416]MBV7437604.1 hypothetical protein [Aeromonas sp. sif2416]